MTVLCRYWELGLHIFVRETQRMVLEACEQFLDRTFRVRDVIFELLTFFNPVHGTSGA